VSFFSVPHIYLAPDTGGTAGGIPPSAAPGAPAPKGVSPAVKSLEKQIQELSDTNKRIFRLLSKSLGTGIPGEDADKDAQPEALSESIGGALRESFDSIKDIFTFDDLFGGLAGGGEDLLGDFFGGGKSKEKAKEKPKLSDMMKMPAEHSLGYTLLYWKLDEIAGLLDGSKSKKEEQGKGIGGFFQGLLKGAVGLAVLAGAMLLFAGALLLFTKLEGSDWAKALLGIAMFALFVTGAVLVAKAVAKEEKTFLDFAKGVLLLTAAMILFGAAVFVMAWVLPYVIPAIPGMVLFGAFVLGAVVVSRLVGKNLKDFAQFGLGMILLTGALILFGAAVFVMNWINPYIDGALFGIGLFLAFVGITAILAKVVGSQLGSFTKFAIGTLLMIAGLVLFAGAIWLVNKMITLEQIGYAAIVALAMIGFVAVTAALGYAMAPLLPGLVVIAVGALALAVSMGLFALAIAITRGLGVNEIERASVVLEGSAILMAQAGILGYRSALAIPGLVLFSAAAVALSVGMIAFATAIKAVASAAQFVPIAIPALREMMRFLTNPRALRGRGDNMELVPGEDAGVLELLAFVGVGVLIKLGVFGTALIPFAEGMSRFADTIQKVAEVGDVVPAGLVGLGKMMKFLSNPDGALDDDGNPIGAGAPGVLQMLDAVSGVTLIKLGAFGLALLPFSESMIKFAEVIRLIANVGDAAAIHRAVIGTGNMMGLLVGGGPANIPQEQSVMGMMDHMSFIATVKLAAFGNALGPLMSSLLNFAEVIAKVATMEGQVDAATPSLEKMFIFLASMDPGKTSIAQLVGAIDRNVSRNLGAFGAALQPFSEGMLTFTEVVRRVVGLDSILDPALSSLSRMMEFLGRAGEIANNVGSGGFLGLGRSSMDKFKDAIQPFGEGTDSFIQIARRIADNQEAIGQSSDALTTMANMLVAAGAVVDRGGTPQRVGQFKNSLDLLGDGINRFTGQVGGTTPFVLDRIADALERIAQIQFGQMFTPFIQFMSHNNTLRETATQLERISEAITPKQPTTLDRISGAIGSLFNQGGSRTGLDTNQTAAYVASPGVDGSLQGYVAGIHNIMQRWDQNPIQLPNGVPGTNMMVIQSSGGGQRQPAFGSGF
jgi:hypothetical protein